MARWKRSTGGAFKGGGNKPPGIGTHKHSESAGAIEIRRMLGEPGVRAMQFGLTIEDLRTVKILNMPLLQQRAAYKKIIRVIDDPELFVKAVKALARDVVATEAAVKATPEEREKTHAVWDKTRAEMQKVMAEVNKKLIGNRGG